MGGTAAKTLLTLLLTALLASGLAACGGSGGDSNSSSASTAETGQTTAPTSPEEAKGGSEKQAHSDKGGSGGSAGSSGGHSSKGEGSASFRTKGGDNSIQNFGEEASSSELNAAESALVGYLGGRAKGDWALTCRYLAASAVKPLEQLAESSPKLKGKGCAAIIGALSAQIPATARANPVTHGVASLRIEGDRAFALFHGPKGVNYFVPMVKEGGQWKVGALAASEFP